MVVCMKKRSITSVVMYWEMKLLGLWLQRIFMPQIVIKFSHVIETKSFWQEMWLVDFHMRSAKKLEIHCNIHIMLMDMRQ